MSDEEKAASIKRMTELEEYENLKREISGARNSLESTLYEYRYQLLEDEGYKPFYTESEAKALLEKIDELDAWMSDNDDDTIITRERELLYKDKLKSLTDISQPILDRYNQVDRRAKAVAKCRKEINRTLNYINTFKNISTHITEQEWSELETLAKETDTWINTTLAKQDATPLNQAPVVLDIDIHAKCFALTSKKMILINKPRPQVDLEKFINETMQKQKEKEQQEQQQKESSETKAETEGKTEETSETEPKPTASDETKPEVPPATQDAKDEL